MDASSFSCRTSTPAGFLVIAAVGSAPRIIRYTYQGLSRFIFFNSSCFFSFSYTLPVLCCYPLFPPTLLFLTYLVLFSFLSLSLFSFESSFISGAKRERKRRTSRPWNKVPRQRSSTVAGTDLNPNVRNGDGPADQIEIEKIGEIRRENKIPHSVGSISSVLLLLFSSILVCQASIAFLLSLSFLSLALRTCRSGLLRALMYTSAYNVSRG